jgi:hypothetical protein
MVRWRHFFHRREARINFGSVEYKREPFPANGAQIKRGPAEPFGARNITRGNERNQLHTPSPGTVQPTAPVSTSERHPEESMHEHLNARTFANAETLVSRML